MSLSADKVPAFISVNIPDGLSIIEVSKVEPGTTPDSSIIEQFKFQIARSWGQDEEKAALSILRQEFGAVITPEGRAVIDGQVDNL